MPQPQLNKKGKTIPVTVNNQPTYFTKQAASPAQQDCFGLIATTLFCIRKMHKTSGSNSTESITSKPFAHHINLRENHTLKEIPHFRLKP